MNDKALARFEALVTGECGKQWLELLYRIQRGGSVDDREKAMADVLLDLGLCRESSAGVKQLTPLGGKCADSAREYLFWVQRNRTLHGEDEYEVTKLANFRDKTVLEIGTGWGCNLLRLATVAKRAVGVEIEPVYLAFSRILARLEGVGRPEIVLGAAEDLPFDSGEFEWVLMFSAMQYMNIHEVLREVRRVLRPGGYVLTTQMLMSGFISGRLTRAFLDGNPRLLLSTASIAINTFWYQFFGWRLRDNISSSATARPIHPTRSFLIKSAERAELRFRPDLSVQRSGLLFLVLEAPA
jgi:SAM-dependent methyltransferase